MHTQIVHSMIDISGDVLNSINLQTGLTFESIIVNSYDEMINEIKKVAGIL